jgi:sugar lactone lactonase YvrE
MAAMLRIASGLLGLFALLVLGIWIRYGGGGHFEDRTADPELPHSTLELVVDLDLPPGNIAVASDGRVFFSFHPEASPPVQVAELVEGKPVPYPPELPTELSYQSVLSLRIDRQERLWVLDNANHGFGTPRLLAFDLATSALVHRYDFPRPLAGRGSHLNDFQVSPDGSRIYIADASIFAKTPALVVYDLEKRAARRLLEGHPSVTPEKYVPVVQGRKMLIFGIFAVRPGVDSIALDRRGEWLYFAPVTSNHMYRIRRSDLDDDSLSSQQLAERVQRFALKTMSDGITTDLEGNIYLSDPDHSSILALNPEGRLRTLLKDPVLRWPDGFSFGPDGWLYVTCSSLHHVIMQSAAHVRANAPYQIFRFRPGPAGIPGH